MPCIQYEAWKPSAKSERMVEQANEIIAEYEADGFDLTLRQLFYQFVSRDWLANSQRNYDNLGALLSRARRAGLVDWSAIVDRTRHLSREPAWESPSDIVESCAAQYMVNPWKHQPCYCECWYEKDALAGVFDRACSELRVPHFSCRGYVSDSEVWSAAQRVAEKAGVDGKEVTIFHFGDHDPSGVDMTRDITERLLLFSEQSEFTVERVALNMDQVRRYRPPPNPAKQTDARFTGYAMKHGNQSWELDALDPRTLAQLVDRSVRPLIDTEAWDADLRVERTARAQLGHLATHWDKLSKRWKVQVDE